MHSLSFRVLPLDPSRMVRLFLAGIAMTTLGCGDVDTPTGPETASELATSSTAALVFRMVAAGGWHSCGVTTDNKAYCWGLNGDGRLGNGTTGIVPGRYSWPEVINLCR